MKYIQKKTNSNPLKSLFEIEHFLKKISNVKDFLRVVKKTKKFHN